MRRPVVDEELPQSTGASAAVPTAIDAGGRNSPKPSDAGCGGVG